MIEKIYLEDLEKICAAENEGNYYLLKALALIGINALSANTVYFLTESKVLSSACGYIISQISPRIFGEGFLDLLEKGYKEIFDFSDIAYNIDLSSAMEEYELEKSKGKKSFY